MAVGREKADASVTPDSPEGAAVLAQLERILATPLFQHSKRYPAFLRYVVEQTLAGNADELKERTLGVAVFHRAPDYDTGADPVVRNAASEVRKRLEEYYSEPGHETELRIRLPAGGYVPEFRASAEALPSQNHPELQPTGRFVPRRYLALGLSLAAALAFFALFEAVLKKPAIRLFWAP